MNSMSLKKILKSSLLFIALIGVTFFVVFKDNSLNNIVETLKSVNLTYIYVGILFMFLFICCEAINIRRMLRLLSYDISIVNGLKYAFVGFFFSSITPSASGGQPMQIYYMKKDKLPIPVTTLVLMIVTITYKAVLVLIGILLWIFGKGFLTGYLGQYMWVFYLGVALNVFCVSFMMILVFAPGLAKWLMVKGMKLLEHFRFLKPRKSRLEKLENSMDQYHATAAFWAGHKLVILKVFLITFVQRIILFTVTYWVYRSLGFHEYGIVTLTILQSVISVSVDMLPLPGGMGISESLYLVIFAPVFGEALLPAMLLSRGISYYAQMLISAVMTCVAHLVIGRKVQEENRG